MDSVQNITTDTIRLGVIALGCLASLWIIWRSGKGITTKRTQKNHGQRKTIRRGQGA